MLARKRVFGNIAIVRSYTQQKIRGNMEPQKITMFRVGYFASKWILVLCVHLVVGEFIENSLQISETFHFSNPKEILSAIQVYASQWNGAMLENLYGDKWGSCAGHGQPV